MDRKKNQKETKKKKKRKEKKLYIFSLRFFISLQEPILYIMYREEKIEVNPWNCEIRLKGSRQLGRSAFYITRFHSSRLQGDLWAAFDLILVPKLLRVRDME